MTVQGYTRTPNDFIESLLDPANEFSGAHIKVALLIARDTIGWRRDSSRISVATFEKRLGISRRTTLEALRGLRAKAIIGAEGKEGTVQSYWITSAKNCTGSEVSTGAENCTDPCEKLHPPVQKTAPAYKEERKSSERKLSKKTSSSKQHPEVPVQVLAPEAAQAADDEAPSEKPSAPEAEAEAERGWTPEVFAGVCRILSEHRGEVLEPDDWARSWLCKGTLDLFLAWWIAVGRKLKPKKPRFGLYEKEFSAAVAGRRFSITWEEEHVLHAYRRKYGLLSPAEVEAERLAELAAAEESRRVAEIERQARERREAEAKESERRHLAALEAAHAARLAKQAEQPETVYSKPTPEPPAPAPAAPLAPDKRAALERQISEYQSGLTLWAKYPDEVRKIRQTITELERERAALDDNPDGTEATREVRESRQALDPRESRQSHRKLQGRERGRPGCLTGTRLAAIIGGCGA
jgi:phage replication O-like protein O